MNLQDVSVSTRVVQIENVGEEVRYTFFERAEGEAKYFPERNVPVYRLRTTQGAPGEGPRYDPGEYRHRSECHKLLPVEIDDGSFSYRPEQPAEDVTDWNAVLCGAG